MMFCDSDASKPFPRAERRRFGRILLGAIFIATLSCNARAEINPWIASEIYDPKKWDTAGPQTASPWLHPPTWTPDQEWGVLSGRINDATALTGSWGGARDWLVERGLSFVGGYSGQPATNPIGGVKENGFSWLNNVSMGAFFDLQRLMDWQGGFFLADFAWKSGGDGLTTKAVGNEFPVQLSNGDDAIRLVHLAYGQELFDNNAEIVAGRIITGEDFATVRLACTSMNQAICGNPIAGNRSISFPTFPYGVWGTRLAVKPEASWYAQTGAYIVYPDFRDPDDHGVKLNPPDDAGVLALGEFGYIVGNNRGEPGLPGTYKIGGYYDNERLTDLETGESERGTWGVYGLAEQMIYSENDSYNKGLSGFLALSYAPPDMNRIDFMAAGGLSYQGPFSGRPNDSLSFISAYGRYSNDLRDAQRARGEPSQNSEVLFELNYRAQLAPWVFVKPDVQMIVRPSGSSAIDNALVIGVGLGFSL